MKLPEVFKSEFARNVFSLLSGTVIAQIITVGLSPFIARLFNAEEFGTFSLFTSIASTITVAATLRYELAIMIPQKEEEAVNVFAISFFINLMISSITLVASIIAVIFFKDYLNSTGLRFYIFCIPFFVLLAGLSQALTTWASRRKKFRVIAISRVGQSTTTQGLSLVSGLLNGSSPALILSANAGVLVSFIALAIGNTKSILNKWHHVSRNRMRMYANKYRDFALINTPHAFIGVFMDMSVLFLLNYFFSKSLVGHYAFGWRLLKLPVGVIGAAVYQVFFQKASAEKENPEKLTLIVRQLTFRLLAMGIPIFLVIGLFAPQIFTLVFSSEWTRAGQIAQILSPWLLMNFILSPLSALTVVLNKQRWAIWFAVVDLFLRCSSITIAGLLHNENLAFVLMTISSTSLLIYGTYWFNKLPSRAMDLQYGKKT